MVITLPDQSTHTLNLPMLPKQMSRINLATFRAIIEMELESINRSQKLLTLWIRDHGYYAISENSSTMIARALVELAEFGLIYERKAGRSTQYLSTVVQRKTNVKKTDSPQTNETSEPIQRDSDDSGAIPV